MKGLMSNGASRAWLVVALVGAVVVVLVFALQLIPRLTGAQDLIDAADPALTDERVAGDRAGIDFISKYVDAADPLVTGDGGGAQEVGALLGLVSKKTGLSTAQILAVLKKEAPHTTALLQSLPFSDVTAERPGLFAFLAKTLKLSSEEVQGALKQSFPRLWQSLVAVEPVTNGWNNVPGTDGLTRFDGTTGVSTVPALRDYFSKDLVAAVERNKDDFQKVSDKGGVGYIPWLLLVVGAVVLVFGLMMAMRAKSSPPGKPAWAVVVAVGVVILGLVLGLSYYPRLHAADRVIGNLEPAFTKERVAGDATGIAMVHQVVLFGDPLMTTKGGGSSEVPKLVKFVADKAKLSDAAVLAALTKNAPKTTAVLQAIPLEAVSAEIPHLLDVVAKTLKVSQDELLTTLRASTPGLAQTITNVTAVTAGWNAIPGTDGLTRFDGTTRVTTMPVLDDYFREDVIPVLPAQRAHFDKLANTWPPVTYFPPLLMVVGLLVVLYGAFGMVVLSKKS